MSNNTVRYKFKSYSDYTFLLELETGEIITNAEYIDDIARISVAAEGVAEKIVENNHLTGGNKGDYLIERMVWKVVEPADDN